MFLGVKNEGSRKEGFITLPIQREMSNSRVYRGFFLSGNRLGVVSRHEKIFLGGNLGVFDKKFQKFLKFKKKFLDFCFFDYYGVFG